MAVISTSRDRPGQRLKRALSGWRGGRGGRLALLACMSSACALDFDIAGREFDCPPEVVACAACNADGTCRVPAVIQPVEPGVSLPPGGPWPPGEVAPDAGAARDAGSPEPEPTPGPDAAAPPPAGPTVPAECAAFQSRVSDSLCVDAGRQCFTLGNVLSPALTLWLDPTTLPTGDSRYWCDRSGKGHHARLTPSAATVVDPVATVADAGARSITLDGASLSLDQGNEPVLRPGNFAVLIGGATPLAASDGEAFELFSSGEKSRIDLTIAPDTGLAVGKISSQETVLVPNPVVTRSSVYDGGFHLFTLYRRSEVRVLDDVLQLRLNGVLEFRGSSIAIPRALDLTSPSVPSIGSSVAGGAAGSAAGRGKVAVAIVLRGSVPEDELARLENFLCEALAVCTAPGPPLSAPPASDAGR
jgi:hypothetical protein